MKEVTVKGGSKLRAFLNRMAAIKGRVLVGVPEGKEDPKGTSLALIAAANEFGTFDGHIPERSYLRGGLRRGTQKIKDVNRVSLEGILDNKMTVRKGLERLGVLGVSLVQREFIDGDFVPNAPVTVERKGSDAPLIDTGQLRQSITFVVDEHEAWKDETVKL